ncbi:hypothetical protein [Candidatus Laterigemmans baculatus]|uniref:hypothetical protein n=1 Tax=Candidatus Laterigemmans baculatus TaxID=2770505 RepID=UPI0013DB158F|nr:hypothetical protein [Candidatus Laterigemmans baculatus]
MDASPVGENREYIQVHRFQLWFSVLGGAVAWTLHLLLSYGVAEFGCVSPFRTIDWIGLSGVAWLEILVTLLTLAVAVASTLIALRIKRRLLGDAAASSSAASDGRVFMARSGVMAGAIFVFIIVVEALPILYFLRDC